MRTENPMEHEHRKHPNPSKDALSLFRRDVDAIRERCQRNSYFLISGALDRISGPSSSSFRAILDHLSKIGSVDDLFAFRDHVRELVFSGLDRSQQMFYAARDAWSNAQNPQGKKFKLQATPYMQFTLAVGRETKADEDDQDLPFPPMTFRRSATNERRGYDLKNRELAASANALIFNILFHPDHTFRDKDEIEKLVTYIEKELDTLARNASVASNVPWQPHGSQ